MPLRWIALLVFVLSSVLNYLDRQVLATMVELWRTRADSPLMYSAADPRGLAQFGELLAAFSIAYAVSAPFTGWFLDRVGLNRGITLSVALWATASAGTGFVHGMTGLLVWRAVLGVAEAAGISAVGKFIGMYLLPEERAVGNATSQLGLSIGAGLAPRLAIFFVNWRIVFFAAAMLSLLWIPLWVIVSRVIPPVVQPQGAAGGVHSEGLLGDRRLWALVIANALSMTLYSLWTNWSPAYLGHLGLTGEQTANYSWAIPLCGYVGGFAGGSLSWGLIRRGMTAVEARKRVCLLCAVACLATALMPLLGTPLLATIGMSFSFFCVAAWSTNLYTLAVDIYGGARAGFAVSMLVFAYGAMQAVISKPIGSFIQRHGFTPVCVTFALLPAVAYALLHFTVRSELEVSPPASSITSRP